MKKFLPLLTFLLLAGTLPAGENVPTKKFIELGWDIPTTQFIRQNWQTMERDAPFDGIMYDLKAEGKSGEYSSQGLWTNVPWERADFQSCIEDMNSCDFQCFRDNFIRVNFSPATVAWEDDAGWEILANKVAICAWVAKATNGAGLAPDFESYGTAMFRFKPECGKSFSEMQALASRRGEQIARAIAKEFPDATLLCLWMNSCNRKAGASLNPQLALTAEGYGLLPAFLEGMLRAAPEEMVFVDGCENGYYIDGAEAFDRYALDMISWTGPCMALVAPEMRQKYRNQVQSGFGIYLDMYTNPEGGTYYRAARDGETRLDRLMDNLNSARNAADQYVWIYGEKNRWWNIPETQNPERPILSWEAALPGLTERVRAMKDPLYAIRRASAACDAGELGANLLKNSDFSRVKEGADTPADWGFWQIEKGPQGRCFAKDETGAFEGVTDGCYIQALPANPGEKFFFRAKARITGNAHAWVNISWQQENGAWTRWDAIVTFTPLPGDEAEWKTISGIAVVPPEARRLVVLPGVGGQATPADECAYDDIELYKMGN